MFDSNGKPLKIGDFVWVTPTPGDDLEKGEIISKFGKVFVRFITSGGIELLEDVDVLELIDENFHAEKTEVQGQETDNEE
jgi:hypothetical protein